MKRVYEGIVEDHFARNSEMLFISGARQVGKTTVARRSLAGGVYLDWDTQEDREDILQGQRHLGERLGARQGTRIVFDELHKYPDWKNFIKGFYDVYSGRQWQTLVTGSSRLDTYRKGGDSLLGRYFHLQMFPLSVAELARPDFTGRVTDKPRDIGSDAWEPLCRFGGFPQPLVKGTQRFHRQWSRMRRDRVFLEDIRTLGSGFDVARMEVLADLVALQSATAVSYSSYARTVRSSVETIQRWLTLLDQLSYCFMLRPWTRNIARSLAKEPRIFLTDWSSVADEGRRCETMAACAILKAVEAWNDTGLGEFALHYVRTKEKREVDFLLTAEGSPWALIEVKANDTALSPHLEYFQRMTGAPHALQIVFGLPYEDVDCFSLTAPSVVPARTFLSQLL